jgi:hypothetical protein
MEYQIEDAERSGVAGNGMGLLNGHTTKRYPTASVEGIGEGVVYEAGV